jgi:hypothetical protein
LRSTSPDKLLRCISGEKTVVWPYHEDALCYDDQPFLMDERACDHEENGIRVGGSHEEHNTAPPETNDASTGFRTAVFILADCVLRDWFLVSY